MPVKVMSRAAGWAAAWAAAWAMVWLAAAVAMGGEADGVLLRSGFEEGLAG